MSGEEAPDGEVEPVGEPGQMSERTAKAIVLVVAVGGLWGAVAVFPWIAYVIVGVLGTLGWQKVRGWIGRRGSGEEAEAEPAADVVEALHVLARGGRSVLLTELRDEIGAADTKTVRALLAESGVRVRDGVRTPAGNGPGVHHEDVPAPFPAADGAHEGRCSCSSTANENANNAHRDARGEGLRVETIGQAGAVIRDPADLHRRHRVQ